MRRFFPSAAIIFVFAAITIAFFYPLLKGNIPFPGDLLVSTAPYNSFSYLGYAPGGVPNKAQGPDVIHELFPWKFFVIDSLKQGQIPFWTPYNFAGNTMMANFQSGTFYPFNVVFFLFSFVDGWAVFIASAPFLAGLFTYLFLRNNNRSRLSSIFGGIVFAFSSYMVVWMEYGNITHTLMWLPLALYFTERYVQKGKWKDIFFLIGTLWLSFVAGYIQGFFYEIVVLIVYFSVRQNIIKTLLHKKTLIYGIALVFPILLALFQLLPTLALFSQSSRGSYSLQQITELLNPWWYSITVLAPDFFGNPAFRNSWFYGTYIERVSFFGVLPFLFALTVVFSFRKKTEEKSEQQIIKVFSLLFLVSFFLALDLFVTRYFFQLPIPILSTTVPTRILSIFVFCGAILAAYGLDYFLQAKNKKQFVMTSGSILVILIGVWMFVLLQSEPHFAIAKKNLLLPSALVAVFIALVGFRFTKIAKRIPAFILLSGFIIIAFTSFDLFYFFHKITPFSPKAFVYPQTSVFDYLLKHQGIDRFWGYGSAYIDSNYQTYNKTYTPEGFDALHLRLIGEYVSGSKDGQLVDAVSRDNVNLASGYGTADLRVNPYRQKALNLLGVKYVLHKDDAFADKNVADIATFPEERYRLVFQDKAWQIYENLQLTPRFFITKNYHVETDAKKAIALLYSDTFDERNEIVLAKQIKLTKSILRQKDVRLVEYTPNKVIIETQTDSDALLFLSDTYSPNWHAMIDGRNAEVLRADHAFRAVGLPPGKHVVTFFYKDRYFEIGLLVSAFFVVVGGVWAFVAVRKKHI